MITRLKENKFFENRDSIIRKAQSCGMKSLWIIVPQGSVLFSPDTFHLMYSYLPGEHPSSEQEDEFKTELKKYGIDYLSLHCKEAIEESINLSDNMEGIIHRLLKNVIPIKALLDDAPLEDQAVVSLEPPSKVA